MYTICIHSAQRVYFYSFAWMYDRTITLCALSHTYELESDINSDPIAYA